MTDNNLLSDYDLVERFVGGDKLAIERLVLRHKDRLYTYIYLIVKNTELAEDIFQDTVIKVMKSLKAGKYTDNGKYLAWVLRIAHNLVIDYYRKKKKIKQISKDEFDTDILNSIKFSDKNIEDDMFVSHTKQELVMMLESLPLDQKEIILLRFYKGLSFREIAEDTGVGINTALGRMRYALINLRKQVDKKNINLFN